MPALRLLVEGDLDVQLLEAVLKGSPPVAKVGGKNALFPRTKDEREKVRKQLLGRVPSPRIFYLRDRDFDFEPPDATLQPTVDRQENGIPVGWRWCRHSIENYLLEPVLISQSTGVAVADVEAALIQAANHIRFYQAARWAIGQARVRLDRPERLQTYPEGLNDLRLPEDISETASWVWANEQAQRFRDRVANVLNEMSLQESMRTYVQHLTQASQGVEGLLLWNSGKNLISALTEWLGNRGLGSPGEFMNRLRDWFIDHPDDVLAAFPEWRALVRLLNE